MAAPTVATTVATSTTTPAAITSGPVAWSDGDIIVVLVAIENYAGNGTNPADNPSISSVSATNFTFTKYSELTVPSGNGPVASVWWGKNNSGLSGSVAITANLAAPGYYDNAIICAVVISGADTTSPFDSDATLPSVVTWNGGTGNGLTPNFNTTTPDDLVLAFNSGPSNFNVPPGVPSSGWTPAVIIPNTENAGGVSIVTTYIAGEGISGTLSGANFSNSVGGYPASFVAAIKPASSPSGNKGIPASHFLLA